MSGTRFRLATVLKLREQTRQERRRSLAEALEAQSLLEARRAELDTALRTQRAAWATLTAPGRINVDRLIDYGRYERVLQVQLRAVEEQSQRLTAEIERRRAALAEAHREVRVLEALRDRQAERARSTDARREQLRLDEVAGRCGDDETRWAE